MKDKTDFDLDSLVESAVDSEKIKDYLKIEESARNPPGSIISQDEVKLLKAQSEESEEPSQTSEEGGKSMSSGYSFDSSAILTDPTLQTQSLERYLSSNNCHFEKV